jgi:hypothetical protein
MEAMLAKTEPGRDIKTMACQKMEACLEEEKPTSVDTKPTVAQQEEVPVEDAEVMLVGEAKKKRRRDQKLAVEHRRQKPKNSTREKCGPQKRLAVANRGTSHRAKVARKTPLCLIRREVICRVIHKTRDNIYKTSLSYP